MGDYWRAVAMLRLDRPRGLEELERCFAAGSPPADVRGPLRGRLLATTVGHGRDGAFEALARLWLPWRGKVFDSGAGRNLFSPAGMRLIRLRWPTYTSAGPDGTAFAFRTSVGPSALTPGATVLRLDYREVADNPSWPVRRVLDELVEVMPDRYLGQALLDWRGRIRRAAWFSLERPAD